MDQKFNLRLDQKMRVFKAIRISCSEGPKSELLKGLWGLGEAEKKLKVRFKMALERVLEGMKRAKIGQKWQKVRVPIGLM